MNIQQTPIPDIRRIWLVENSLVTDMNNPELTEFGRLITGDLMGFIRRDWPEYLIDLGAEITEKGH